MLAAVRGGEPNVRVIATGGSHRLDITDLDRVGLFADTAGLLAAEGHTVRTAILRTVDGIAVNEWHVESPSGAVPDPDRIERGLARLGRGDRAPLATLDRRRAHVARPVGAGRRSARPGRRAPWSCPGASSDATVLEVRAQDRPGMLHELGRGARRRRHLGALGPHRHLCRADARHVLHHRVRRPAAAAGPGRAGGQPGHRHLRRHLSRAPYPLRERGAKPVAGGSTDVAVPGARSGRRPHR